MKTDELIEKLEQRAKSLPSDDLMHATIQALRNATDPARFYGSELFWKFAPEWATCAAADEDYEVWVYDSTPQVCADCWGNTHGRRKWLASLEFIEFTDWKSSLIYRPGHEPEKAIAVGDRVTCEADGDGEVICITGEWYWVNFDDGQPITLRRDELTPLTHA